MRVSYLRWTYSILSICFIVTFSSCAKEGLGEDFQDAPEPNSEFVHAVSIDEAETQLVGLLSDMEEAATRSGEVFAPRKIVSRYSTGTPVATRTEGEIEPYVHVFNFENNDGFAIMSGDDRVDPLLALTFSGELTPETEVENPGMIIFLSNMEELYTNEIKSYDEASSRVASAGNREVYGPWKSWYYGMHGGNCNVQWGQGYPYNMYCPLKNGSRTATGCVATAVAQLMSVYKHPASYGEYTFDWSEMNKHINSSHAYAPAYSQIARLMQQLGLSKNLDMKYGLSSEGGSGANPANIPRTLKNFGFSNGGSLQGYNTNTVVSELRYGYHVLIGGCESRTLHKKKFLGITIKKYYTYSAGHRWLAHGLLERARTISTYNSDNVLVSEREESVWYPLCNFGWGGYGDGYYLSGAFDTNKGPAYDWVGPHTRSDAGDTSAENETTPNNFQYNMTAVIGIRK